MKGKLVIIRAYGGRPLMRRIWKVNKKVIFVTDDSKKGIISVGFPLQDAFKYDEEIVVSMRNHDKDRKWDWTKLKPLFE